MNTPLSTILLEQCKTCKNNQDGHCINGLDNWKFRMYWEEVECEWYEESEVRKDD